MVKTVSFSSFKKNKEDEKDEKIIVFLSLKMNDSNIIDTGRSQ